jgi:nucleoside-diphosphate-sugar epimerase
MFQTNDISSFFKEKKVLITGSNGFVGRNLVERLLSLGSFVLGLGTKEKSLTPGIKYKRTDVTKRENISELLKDFDPDVVFHLAAVVTAKRDYSLFPRMLDLHVNVIMHFYQELSIRHWKGLFVNFGSAEEYGDYNGLPYTEDLFERSTSPYGVTKTAGSRLAYMLGKNESFPIITVRPGVLYGKYQSSDKFPAYVEEKLKNNEPLILSKCEQTRDFMNVDDFITNLLRVIASERCDYGEIYNIASGTSITLRDYVEKQKRDLNSNSEIRYGELPYRKNEIMEFNISIEKVKRIISVFPDNYSE